jgi:hypothetical protein
MARFICTHPQGGIGIAADLPLRVLQLQFRGKGETMLSEVRRQLPSRYSNVRHLVACIVMIVVAWGTNAAAQGSANEFQSFADALNSNPSSIPLDIDLKTLPGNAWSGGNDYPLQTIKRVTAADRSGASSFAWTGGVVDGKLTARLNPSLPPPLTIPSAHQKDCNGSNYVIALFTRRTGEAWTFRSHNMWFGEWDGSACTYNITGPPEAAPGHGAPYLTHGSGDPDGGYEFRVATRAWANNDVKDGYSGNRCTHLACYFPLKIQLHVLRNARFILDFANVDDVVDVLFNGVPTLHYDRGQGHIDPSQYPINGFLKDGPNDMKISLTNTGCFQTSLTMTITQDGRLVDFRNYSHNYGFDCGVTKLDWRYVINKNTGFFNRMDCFDDRNDRAC